MNVDEKFIYIPKPKSLIPQKFYKRPSEFHLLLLYKPEIDPIYKSGVLHSIQCDIICSYK